MKRGFTLVELLVVVAIIVVLLAILVPATEKAMYQAELAVCMTRQRALATGVTFYTSDYSRHYPLRGAVSAGVQTWPMNISCGQAAYDDRFRLAQYVPLNKTLNCPMGPYLEIENSKPTTFVFGAYNMWFGWQFTRTNTGTAPNLGQKESGMRRRGDRWGWYDEIKGYRLSSSLLVNTRYIDHTGNGSGMSSSHKASTYATVKVQDEPQAAAAGTGGTSGEYTYFRWDSYAYDRGFIDMNATFSDLSAQRYDQLDWNDDDRMARTPGYSSGAGWPTTHWEYVPKQQ